MGLCGDLGQRQHAGFEVTQGLAGELKGAHFVQRVDIHFPKSRTQK